MIISYRIPTLWIFLTVVDLTAAHMVELNNSILELLDNGPWLINFYAPWCAYCRRLEPVYEKVGHYFATIRSPIKVARLDATTHLKAGRFFKVEGFPTIKLVKNDQTFTYTGDRSLHSIISFASRANGPAVKTLDNVTAFEATAALVQNDPFFVLVGYRDPLLRVAYEKLAQQYRLLMWFFSVPSFSAIPTKYAHLVKHAEQAHRGLVVFKDGDGLVFPCFSNSPEPETFSFMEQRLREWLLRERYPIFIEAPVSDLWEIGTTEMLLKQQREIAEADNTRYSDEESIKMSSSRTGRDHAFAYRLVALFLLNPPQSHDAVSLQFKKFGQNLARQRVPDLVRHYQFAWIDQSLDVLSNLAMVPLSAPSLIVVDPVTRVIYLNPNQTRLNGLFTLESKVVFSYLMAVADGRVPGYGGNTIPIRLRRLGYNFIVGLVNFIRSSPIVALLVFGVPTMFLGCVGYLCCCMDEQYDDMDFDSSSVLHSDRVPIISDEPRCLGPSNEVGDDESVRRRYALHLPKRPTREATEMGPVISKEEVETRLAAYHDWKKSNQIN